MIFRDRIDAGKKLAFALKDYSDSPNTIIIALPRGGIVVAAVVARELKLPLDIVCPRKIGAPFNHEFAIGAITETGVGIFSEEIIKSYQIQQSYLDKEIEKEKKEASFRLKTYRGDRPKRNLKDKIVIVIDDGIATGSTMFAAIETIKAEKATQIIVAVPVSPPDTFKKLEKQASKALCLSIPHDFYAVGQFYQHFEQTSDQEVIKLMQSLKN